MASIANNHLSQLANKGRHGDTELAHVTKEEQNLLKAMGGSGSINPQTGLKEFFPWAAAGMFVTSVAQSASSGKIAQSGAKSAITAANQGLESLKGAETGLETAKQAKTAFALGSHEHSKQKFASELDTTVADINKQMNQAVKKSGLANSGTLKEKESTQSKRVAQTYTSGVEGLMGKLGETMAGIEGWYEGEKGRIKSERARFTREKKLAQEQADSWYLGKGLI